MATTDSKAPAPVLLTSKIVDHLRDAADALLAGDESAADRAIAWIHVDHGPQVYSHATPRVAYPVIGSHANRARSADVVVSTKAEPPKPQVKARVMQRDGFTCRYCLTPVLPQKVLGVFSALWPEAFPYHMNCKREASHIAYRTNYAEIDHVESLAGGGDSLDENLVVACLVCNSRKGRAGVDALGWVLNDTTNFAWDGFVPLYRELLDRAASRYRRRPELAALVDAQKNPPTAAAHRTWLAAFGLPTD